MDGLPLLDPSVYQASGGIFTILSQQPAGPAKVFGEPPFSTGPCITCISRDSGLEDRLVLCYRHAPESTGSSSHGRGRSTEQILNSLSIGREALTVTLLLHERLSWRSAEYTARSHCLTESIRFLTPSRARIKLLGVL